MRVVRVDVATGRRELWKELGPADISGVIDQTGVHITPDERGVRLRLQRAPSRPTSTS